MKKIILGSLITFLLGTVSVSDLNATGLQDPMKSSKYPNSDPPSSAPDGSSGKYRDSHKHANGHNFAKKKYHIKKVKKHNSEKNIKPSKKVLPVRGEYSY